MTPLFEGQFFSAIPGISFNLSFFFVVVQNIIFFIHFIELVIILGHLVNQAFISKFKIHSNPKLSCPSFEQPGPGVC